MSPRPNWWFKTTSFARRSTFTQCFWQYLPPCDSTRLRLDLAIMHERATGSETTHARIARGRAVLPVLNTSAIEWDFKFQITIFKVVNIDQTFLDNSSKTRFAGSTFQIAVGLYYDQRNFFA